MADISQMMGGGGAMPPSPGQVPPGQPGGQPGAAPLPPSGPPGGQSQQKGGSGNLIMMLLTFLAGAGLGDVVKHIMQLTKPPGSKTGAAKDASKSPQQSIPPQVMQQMMQQQGQQAQQQDPKLMMLIQQLLGKGQ